MNSAVRKFLFFGLPVCLQLYVFSTPAQEGQEPCFLECDIRGACQAGKHSPSLKDFISKGEIPKLEATSGGAYDAWATSMLAPVGKDPSKGKECPEIEHEHWTCMYSAKNVQDGDSKTAWVEGVAGPGIGEIVVAHINTARPSEIWTGFGASEKLHQANAVPRKVIVYVLESSGCACGQQCGDVYSGIRVLAKGEADLKNKNGYQQLPLPKHDLKPWKEGDPPSASFVAIEILSVYPGSKYQDTCISEIRNTPEKD